MQRIDILGLQAFICISEEGSFRGAADRLNISPTAITRRLQKLEDSLGVILISRTTRQVTLTKLGASYLQQAQQMVSAMENSLETLRTFGRFGQGSVSFACLPTVTSLYLPKVLARFSELNATNVQVFDLSATEILDRVRDNKVEFGITSVGADYQDLATKPLFSEPFVALVPSSHPLASSVEVEWKDLKDLRLISIGARSGTRRLIDTSMRAYGITLNWSYEVQHLSSAVSLACAGVGVAILPASARMMTQSSDLVSVNLSGPVVRRTVGLIRRVDMPLTPPGKVLCNLIETLIR